MTSIVFWRSLLQVCLSLIYYLADRLYSYISGGEERKFCHFLCAVSPWGDWENLGLLLWRSIFGSLAVGLFYLSIQFLPLPDAVTLQFTLPVFSAVIASIILREPWKIVEKIGVLVCGVGVLLLTKPTDLLWGAESDEGVTFFFQRLTAIAFGLLGALLAAAAYCTVRLMGEKTTAVQMTTWYGIVSLFITVALSLAFPEEFDACWKVPSDTQERISLAGVGLGGWMGQMLASLSLQREKASRATLCTTSQIVFAYIFEIFWLHEPLNVCSLVGSALILAYMGILFYTASIDEQEGYQELGQAADFVDL